MTSLTTPGSLGFRLDARSLAVVALSLSLVAVGIVPSPAQAKATKEQKKEQKDPREMDARQAFAAGNYKEALDIYTKLYAEKLHPTYLRNIARCYQNLGDADHAISSFREYLRKAKDVGAEERTEVEGYIREMEDLQKKNAAAAAPPVVPVQPLPPPQVEPVAPPPTVMVQQPAPPPVKEATPFYKKAWFWGVVGGVVVAATVGGLWAGGVFSEKSHNSCVAPYYCGN
jgi:tetratricopeptide (TPR) repeat protein